ncbi:urea transporter [Actinomadura sp. 1N219]|uniref:urea transporter n=1 Tax=Actinomadura sp. 1N219 TaxID=3375152 RepID=UPI0037961FB3
MRSSSGEVSGGARPPVKERPSDAASTVPKGVAQVIFQTSQWTGLIFIAGLFAGGWQFGVFGLLGTLAATVTAYLMGVAWDQVSIGLEGFCGTLTGVALALYLGANWMTAALVVGATVAGSVLTSAMGTVLKPYGLPASTGPFCVVTTVMAIGAPSFHRVWENRPDTAPPSATDPGTAMSWSDFWHGLLNGVAQVFFQDEWYVGVIFLAGLALASRFVAAVAAASSLVGLLIGWWLGAQAADIGAGLYGYNSVLTGVALAGTFIALSPVGAVYAAIGAATAAGLTAGLTNLFDVVGGHTLTWPYVLVCWVFLAAVPRYPKIRRAG